MRPNDVVWDAWIVGELEFPPKKLEAWKKATLDPRAHTDWPAWIKPPRSADGDIDFELRTLTQWNSSWRYREDLDHVRVFTTSRELTVRAYMTGWWFSFLDGTIAALVRAAAPFGAKSRMAFIEAGSS